MKPIFTSLSPNTEKDDIALSLRLIIRPWIWKKFSVVPRNVPRGSAINADETLNYTLNYAERLEESFKRYLGVKHAFAFNSGRSGFLAILNGLGLEQGSEVLLQGFTCNAVVNPIIWSGLKPVFVDIKQDTLNIDPKDLERKISSKSRGVVVQHTFGLPAEMNEILEICKKHNLILIEDCAHSLGATYHEKASRGNRKTGTFGKASFFSFGRDKIISSVYGGMAVTNDHELGQKIKNFQEKCDSPSNFWIFQQLLHPILCNFLIIPLYGFFGLGRWVLGGLQKIRVLSKAVHKKEKKGKQPNYIPKKMPNALAILALHQFKKLDKFISHQRKIAQFYNNNLSACRISDIIHGRVYMRYPILIKNKNTDEILKKARKSKMFLNDGWRKSAIVPVDTDQKKMGYILGSCPVAEKVAQNILNLPTHINISQRKARKIINFLKQVLQ